jgi:hypothetical protein
MSELNLTNNNLATPSKESAVQPVSMVEGKNTNVNSPGSQSSEFASVPDQVSVPQCIFTTAASEMKIVHENNDSNMNAMQIVSPKDSSTVASVSDSICRMLQNPYERTNNTMNNNQSHPRTAASNVVHTSISHTGCVAQNQASQVMEPNQFPDSVILRFAYVNTSNEQTVVFWFEQKGGRAFWVQNLINKAIKNRDPWVLGTFPFAAKCNEPGESLFWYRNNTKIQVGRNNLFGIKLFHYTTGIKKNRVELTSIAHELRDKLCALDCPIQIIINNDGLFLYDRSCVWSNLMGEQDCYSMIHRELDIDEFFPSIWDEKQQTLGKYFFPRNLTKEQAFMLYAPIEEMNPNIPRTEELLQEVKARNAARQHQTNLLRNVGANLNPMDDIIEQVQQIDM